MDILILQDNRPTTGYWYGIIQPQHVNIKINRARVDQ